MNMRLIEPIVVWIHMSLPITKIYSNELNFVSYSLLECYSIH